MVAPINPPVTELSSPMIALDRVREGQQHDQVERVELGQLPLARESQPTTRNTYTMIGRRIFSSTGSVRTSMSPVDTGLTGWTLRPRAE